jgi:MFS family permease
MDTSVPQVLEETAPADLRTRADRIALPALITATGVSSLGNGLTMLAIPWFVLITTGSAARTGMAAATTSAALIVAGILGGTLVDRLGFKRASIISDLASGVTVALIPTLYLLDLLNFWMLLTLVFLGAVLDGPGASARRAMIPSLVKRAGTTLERVNSAMQFAQLTTGDFLAPLAAGILITLIGAASVLYVNTATFALSMLIVAIAIPGAIRAVDNGNGAEAGGASYFADLKEGFRFVLADPFLRRVIPISIVVNFLFAPMFFVVLPVLASDVFDSARAFGIMAAGFGAGAGIGTLLYGAFGHRIRRFTVYWGALAGASAGLWLLTASTTLWMAILATVLVGFSVGPVNAAGMVIMQARVPERMMGRVFGLLYAGSGLATPAGLIAGGVAVQIFGLPAAMVASALGVTACAVWVVLNRELKTLVDETETPTSP